MSNLTFQEYQTFTITTAKYPQAGEGTPQSLAYVGLGLGETGEIQGKLKKIIRDDAGILTVEKKQAIIDEAGDVCWYLSQLANELQVPFELFFTRNVEKLSDRQARGVIKGSGDNR